MSIDIARAWKDAQYQESLSSEERAQLPQSPIGSLELTDSALATVNGGFCPQDPCGFDGGFGFGGGFGFDGGCGHHHHSGGSWYGGYNHDGGSWYGGGYGFDGGDPCYYGGSSCCGY
ncbi:mersacidin/lichenicidin family type 2 lantibiotic [Dictyobacter kobayashii]|uniref:Mersacidin/lichenicidin family type 2 lantibiotic n=1 Tax=Dictyobacter kobayashii TaxID=2014872 RepID=A0A402ATD7_9CHLR|nr:mersacidin/lichenicidin family type 2 lantibiotic [Dictyobacter kobayashii]GCE22329.1 hypothetical protein KDK_61290 [Dictyobacter kobayashii]